MAAAAKAFADLSVDEYGDRVRGFFREHRHPVLRRPYLSCGYRPMVELMRFLEAHGFTTYIASGGDRDFLRPVGIHHVRDPAGVGDRQLVALEYREGPDGSDVLYKAEMEFFDDGPTKPVRIWSRVGRRPILAAGNANGVIPMLRFTGGPALPALRLLVRHDDADRELDYIDGAEQALTQAAESGWTVVSIQRDWKEVFGAGHSATIRC